MSHPAHIRKTAMWLYTRHELPIEDVAERLCVSYQAVRTWLHAAKLLRTRAAGYSLTRQKTDDLQERRRRAYILTEQGVMQKDIAKELGVSVRTVYRYVQDFRAYIDNQNRADTEHNIESGYRRRSLVQREDRFPVAIRDEVLDRLPERERRVLEARIDGAYQHEIASELGVTEARVCQIEAAARERYRRLAAA